MGKFYTYNLPVYNVVRHNNPAHNNEPDIGKEQGFSKLKNDMADALMKCRVSGTENQVFWVIFRKTTGWRKKQDQIALSQFEKETGIARKKIPALIKQLVEKKMVIIKEKGNGWEKDGNHNISSYAINTKYSQWHKAPGIKPKVLPYFSNRPSRYSYNPTNLTVPQLGPDLPQTGGNTAPQMGVALSPFWGTTTDTQKTYITNNTTHSHRATPDEENLQIKNCKLQTISKKENKKENKQKKSMRPDEKINKNKITGKTKKPVDQIIIFAAKECKVTIIGDKLKLLNQLMGIYDEEKIKSALKNFAGYQQEPRQDRRYPISNDFRSFVHKFDEFADGARVAMRLEAEKRWEKEGRGATHTGKDRGATIMANVQSANEQEESQEEFDPIAWNLKEIAGHETLIRKRKYLLDMYQESIDRQGLPAREALDLPTFRKYENFKKEVERTKDEIKELRAEIEVEQTKKEKFHVAVQK